MTIIDLAGSTEKNLNCRIILLIMRGFDSQKVLERILQEAPILSNRRGEVEAELPELKKVPIFAFYYNRGLPDPELHYDRVKNPIRTTPDSTLCEVYSFWGGDPNVQDLITRLTKEGEIKPGQVLYQGPWLECPALDDEELFREVRKGAGYSFYHSASAFHKHFNRICEALGYEPRLIDLYNNENCRFFGRGAFVVQVQSPAQISVDGRVASGNIKLRAQLGINLTSEDPTLRQVLSAVSDAYERIVKVDLSDAELYVNPKTPVR